LVDQFASLRVVSILPGIFGADPILVGDAAISERTEAVGWGDRITGVVHVIDLVAAMILAAEKTITSFLPVT